MIVSCVYKSKKYRSCKINLPPNRHLKIPRFIVRPSQFPSYLRRFQLFAHKQK